MPEEVPAALGLYLSGHIEQFKVRQDPSGSMFLDERTHGEEADAVLEKLPLGQA